MKIWGITRTGLDFALAVGSAKFEGNVKFEREPRRRGRAWLVTLRHRAIGPGTKITNQKRGPAVCFHVHTEFMRAIFQINPNAKIKTVFAEYKNRNDLEDAIASWDDFSSLYPKDHCECKPQSIP